MADNKEKIAEALKSWNEKTQKVLAKNPERKAQFETLSEIPINRLYTPLDIEHIDYLEEIGFPGQYPFVRGVQNTMHRGRLWTMRQYAGFGSAEDTNKRFRYLLEQGQTGLSVAFDLPTQIGYDSDHPLSVGEVGKVGVAIDSVRDMAVLFDQIPLDQVSTSMTINSPAAVITAMYLALADKSNISFDKLRGTIQNDVLKEYIARGTYIFPPHIALRITTNIIEYCAKNMPQWNSISISGYHMREAGCTATQEVAFTLANGITYVQSVINAGLKVDEFAPRLSFFFSAHLDFFEEIAKYRAARRLWAKIMKERFKAQDPRSWMLRYHVQTAGCSLTAQQPLLNILRTGFEALSAVLGGCQSLHTNSYDEALALPSEQAVQIALRTQQIIAYEIGVTETVDPLGGSYYVEYLTDKIESDAEQYIKKIDEMGGMVTAIESGYVQQEIAHSAYEYQKKVESKERIVVGMNKFQIKEPPPTGLLKVDMSVGERQAEKLKVLRAERDNQAVLRCLEDVKRAAKDEKENLMPPILEAVKAEATLGEICDALREVFGEYVGGTSY
ncbi:MAG: methylmalonyl-CoA mutase family protein [Thermodesulfovibrionales bacterium]|nr:methylmalonyl-CoA mutase family protein [Thermodesulfovibrionales bacterium]